jgi:hypothetical protein
MVRGTTLAIALKLIMKENIVRDVSIEEALHTIHNYAIFIMHGFDY